MISIIVATSPSSVIAVNGKIPWKCSSDMKHFKKMTIDHNVIMGRKTWDSLNNNPLPNRNNFIITRNINNFNISSSYVNPKNINTYCFIASSIEDAINKTSTFTSDKQNFIIGGEEIYNQSLQKKIVDRIYLSIINENLINSYNSSSEIKYFKFGQYSKWNKIKSEVYEEFKLLVFEKV